MNRILKRLARQSSLWFWSNVRAIILGLSIICSIALIFPNTPVFAGPNFNKLNDSAKDQVKKKCPTLGSNSTQEDAEDWEKCIEYEAAQLIKQDPASVDPNASSGSTGSSSSGTKQKKEDKTCFHNAGGLGFFLCPIINFVHKTLDRVYRDYVATFLEIKSGIFNYAGPGGKNATYEAWDIFRNIANVIFIIMFTILIFSQLTGFGISNYGIKKNLPRLIVVAILINISYYLCQLAIDISNILGHSLKALFASMAPAISGLPGNTAAAGAAETAIFALEATAIIAAAAIYIISNPAAIATGILVLVSALFAAITGYVILVMRQAAAVILTCISPVALACLLLPNTERIFKRYVETFKALLITFPIIGAMLGAGQLVSAILFNLDPGNVNGSASGGFMKLTAMVSLVAPFFAIPSLVKKSLAGIGDLGSKVGRIGKIAGRATTGALDKTDRFKRFRNSLGSGVHYNKETGQYESNSFLGVDSKLRKAVQGNALTGNYARKKLASGMQDTLKDFSQTEMLKKFSSVGYLNKKVASANREANNQDITEHLNAIMEGRSSYIDNTGVEVKIDPDNVDNLTAAYVAVYEAGDLNKATALRQHLMANEKEEGRVAIDKATKILSDRAIAASKQVDADPNDAQAKADFVKYQKAVQNHASMLLNSYGKIFKNKAPSQFAVLSAINSGNFDYTDGGRYNERNGALQSGASIDDYTGRRAHKYSEETFIDMDDYEIDRNTESIGGDNLSGDTLVSVRNTMLDALNNEHIRKKLTDNRKKAMQNFISKANVEIEQAQSKLSGTIGGASGSIKLNYNSAGTGAVDTINLNASDLGSSASDSVSSNLIGALTGQGNLSNAGMLSGALGNHLLQRSGSAANQAEGAKSYMDSILKAETHSKFDTSVLQQASKQLLDSNADLEMLNPIIAAHARQNAEGKMRSMSSILSQDLAGLMNETKIDHRHLGSMNDQEFREFEQRFQTIKNKPMSSRSALEKQALATLSSYASMALSGKTVNPGSARDIALRKMSLAP